MSANSAMEKPATTDGRKSGEVHIVRVVSAPRDLVFRAWLDPQQLVQWYAPHGCTIRFRRLEPRVGGSFHSCIRTPQGYECWVTGEYREIQSPERIVYTMANCDEQEKVVAPASLGMDPEWPSETLLTVTLADLDGKTQITLHQTVSEVLAKRTGAHPSWLQMLDRLEQWLVDHRA